MIAIDEFIINTIYYRDEFNVFYEVSNHTGEFFLIIAFQRSFSERITC